MSQEATQQILKVYNSCLHSGVNSVAEITKLINSTDQTKHPEISLCYSLRADLMLQSGNYEQAYRDAMKAHALKPKQLEVLYSLISVHIPRDDTNDSKNKNKTNPYADNQKAKYYTQQMYDQYFDNPRALQICGASFKELGLYNDALKCYHSALDLTKDTKLTAKLRVALTECYLDRYRICPETENEKIMEYLLELINFNQNTLSETEKKTAIEELIERGEFYLEDSIQKRNYDSAFTQLKKIVRSVPLSEKLVLKTNKLIELSQNYTEGIEIFSMALTLNEQPYMYTIFHSRGLLFEKQGLMKQANADFSNANKHINNKKTQLFKSPLLSDKNAASVKRKSVSKQPISMQTLNEKEDMLDTHTSSECDDMDENDEETEGFSRDSSVNVTTQKQAQKQQSEKQRREIEEEKEFSVNTIGDSNNNDDIHKKNQTKIDNHYSNYNNNNDPPSFKTLNFEEKYNLAQKEIKELRTQNETLRLQLLSVTKKLSESQSDVETLEFEVSTMKLLQQESERVLRDAEKTMKKITPGGDIIPKAQTDDNIKGSPSNEKNDKNLKIRQLIETKDIEIQDLKDSVEKWIEKWATCDAINKKLRDELYDTHRKVTELKKSNENMSNEITSLQNENNKQLTLNETNHSRKTSFCYNLCRFIIVCLEAFTLVLIGLFLYDATLNHNQQTLSLTQQILKFLEKYSLLL